MVVTSVHTVTAMMHMARSRHMWMGIPLVFIVTLTFLPSHTAAAKGKYVGEGGKAF